jgi:hypothetical protein
VACRRRDRRDAVGFTRSLAGLSSHLDLAPVAARPTSKIHAIESGPGSSSNAIASAIGRRTISPIPVLPGAALSSAVLRDEQTEKKVANRSVPTALSELPTSLRRLCQFKTRAAPLRPVPSDVASAAMRSLCGFAFVLRFAQPCTGLPLRGCISDSFASWGSTRSQLAARSTNRTIWPRSAVFDCFCALSSSKPREFKSCDRVGNPLSSSLRTFWRAIFRRGSGPGPTRAPTLITDHAAFLINQGTSVGCGCLRSTINLGRRRYHHYSCEESRERLLGRDGNASDICREFKASAKWDNHGGREATKPKSNLPISRGGTQSFTLLLWHRQ